MFILDSERALVLQFLRHASDHSCRFLCRPLQTEHPTHGNRQFPQIDPVTGADHRLNRDRNFLGSDALDSSGSYFKTRPISDDRHAGVGVPNKVTRATDGSVSRSVIDSLLDCGANTRTDPLYTRGYSDLPSQVVKMNWPLHLRNSLHPLRNSMRQDLMELHPTQRNPQISKLVRSPFERYLATVFRLNSPRHRWTSGRIRRLPVHSGCRGEVR